MVRRYYIKSKLNNKADAGLTKAIGRMDHQATYGAA